jgi:two-component system OmpR family sensor kinase
MSAGCTPPTSERRRRRRRRAPSEGITGTLRDRPIPPGVPDGDNRINRHRTPAAPPERRRAGTSEAIISSHSANSDRFLRTLQQLLAIPGADLESALTHATDALTQALEADKVDAFLYDEARDSLVAVGASTQPLSALQRRLGLDVIALSNGGRSAMVYQSGERYHSGRVDQDAHELAGVREALGVRSEIGVPLEVGGRRRGMVMAASQKPDYFDAADVEFVATAARWVGLVAERSQMVEAAKRKAVDDSRNATAEELIAVLSHDLRNYLSPATLRLHSVSRRASREGREQDVGELDSALASLARVGALVGDLLDTARLDNGFLHLSMQPVDLGTLLAAAARELSTPDNEVVVKAYDPPAVTADPSRLRQCIDNVIANAMAHSPPGAAVHAFVRTEVHDARPFARIDIVDEGPGIPDAMLPRLFDQYATSREAEGGAGLGLYIARRIASAHGGQIEARTDPGKGARFTLRLPALSTTEPGARAA